MPEASFSLLQFMKLLFSTGAIAHKSRHNAKLCSLDVRTFESAIPGITEQLWLVRTATGHTAKCGC